MPPQTSNDQTYPASYTVINQTTTPATALFVSDPEHFPGTLNVPAGQSRTVQFVFVIPGTGDVCIHEEMVVETSKGNMKIKDIKPKSLDDNIMIKDDKGNNHAILENIKFSKRAQSFILIKKDAFGNNSPDNDFYITLGHPIKLNDKEVQPNELIRDNDLINLVHLEEPCTVYTLCTQSRLFTKINNIWVATWNEKEFHTYASLNNIHYEKM